MSSVPKEFLLSHIFNNVSSMKEGVDVFSNTEEHSGFNWKICAKLTEGCLACFCYCSHPENAKNWSVQVSRDFRLISVTGRKFSARVDRIYSDKDGVLGFGPNNFIKWEDMIKDYAVDDKIMIQVHVKISKVTGIQKKKLRSFDESAMQFSDIVLVVENEKFYVSKLKMPPAEKKFVLTHVVKDFQTLEDTDGRYSSQEEHYQVPWRMSVIRLNGHLWFLLHCEKEPEHAWSIETEVTLQLHSPNGKNRQEKVTMHFTPTSAAKAWANFIHWNELQYHFLLEGQPVIEAHAKILKTTGIEKKKLMSFDESTKEFSDVTLIVKDEKFYVSKTFLGSQSSYFQSLFHGDFKEFKSNEIPLSIVEVKHFQNFLELLHGELAFDDNTVDGILKLADMYDAQTAVKRCEQYLIESSEKTLKEKLNLAIRYRFEDLKHNCLLRIETVAEIKSVLPGDLKELDPEVSNALLQKMILLHQ